MRTRGTSHPDNEGGRPKDGRVKGGKSKSERRPRCGRKLKGERPEGDLRVRPKGERLEEGQRVAFLMPREAAQVFQLQDHPGVLSWSQEKG